MSHGSRNNGERKWLVVLAVLLLNAVYIISTTMRFNPSFVDNIPLEFDVEDAHVDTNDISNDSLMQEPRSKDEHIAKKVPEETNEISDKEVGDSAMTSAPPPSPPPTLEDAEMVGNSTNFTRYDDVVIVTKVLWAKDLKTNLKPNLCYLSHAYNDKRRYDIVVFTTMPWTKEEIAELQAMVAPSKLTVALEGPPLEEQVAAMTPEEKEFQYSRCNVTAGEELSWFHYCTEPGTNLCNNLAYSWQAEFRAYHIWTHPAIMKYKYMIWMDSDARVATTWDGDNDPMKMMVENDLNLMFSGFPYGNTKNIKVKAKMEKVYGKSICVINRLKEGILNPHFCDNDIAFKLQQVAGNHHISNLETYRKPIHQKFLKEFVGDYRFGRQFDDQIAVTIPAVMEDRGKAWHERSHGLKLMIAHHRMFDNVKGERAPANWQQFFKKMKKEFAGIEERCGKYIT